mmetsp:Transcript_42062/g.78150  ORF Transcript_42062/g.78150 Transcript_42062/m.78150 type:complete len:137 (+) Transcript_42062:53-463(+)
MPIYGSSGIAGARMHRSHVACLPFYSNWSPPSCPPAPQLPRSDFTARGDEKVPNTKKVNAIVSAALDSSGRDLAPKGYSLPKEQKTSDSLGWTCTGDRENPEPFHGFRGSPFALTPRRRTERPTMNATANLGRFPA